MMKKEMYALAMAGFCVCSMTTGCGKAASAPETTAATSAETTTVAAEASDNQGAADAVAALIAAIYVQQRTVDTDAQCIRAKEAWDALTDAQKELVEGEYADPDYFGRDTGDASLDNPLNQDEIGENELLVVSFGTSFNDSRTEDIGGIEKALQEANPDWSVRRAFTAQIIINHIQARDEEKIDNMDQALERAVANGVKNLVIQPTHLMHGAEYDELVEAVDGYTDKFESIKVAEPLLGEVGSDATVINDDKKAVAEAVMEEAVKTAGYDSVGAAAEDGTAFVLMGHGTSHTAKVTYTQMQTQMDELGFKNVFIGTVEGEPEDTACSVIIDKVKEAGYKKIVLRPLMVVAGDHANNDMAGDEEDSWKSQFEAAGVFDKVDAQVAGLGGIAAIQNVYVAHTAAVINIDAEIKTSTKTEEQVPEDGVYQAEFHSDSGMFRVNEANEGKGILTVKDGEMTLHISLASKNIVNLYVGLAEDAKKGDAQLLAPTMDTVTYKDGMTEEVHGYDIPVSALNQEFDLALIGTKGIWYDHKVSVSHVSELPKEKAASEKAAGDTADTADNSEYTANVILEGGSGKAAVESPARITEKDGITYATIIWSSSNYDYMIVGGTKYLDEGTGENSTFTFPIPGFDVTIPVVGNTTAMSTPHEVEYTLYFERIN